MVLLLGTQWLSPRTQGRKCFKKLPIEVARNPSKEAMVKKALIACNKVD